MFRSVLFGLVVLASSSLSAGESAEPIRFDCGFEGASLGRIEQVGDSQYRLHVAGQQDSRGRNRQATWYLFRMDNVRDRDLVLTLTDLVGEYNDKPGAVPMGPALRPVFSYDGRTWQHWPEMTWDAGKKEAVVRLRPEQDRLWVAHVPPYPHSQLLELLQAIRRRANCGNGSPSSSPP